MMTIRTGFMASLLTAFLVAGVGCSNKADAERDALRSQNAEVMRQLDAERAQRADAERRALAGMQAPAPVDPMNPPGMEGGTGAPLDLSAGGRGAAARPIGRTTLPNDDGTTASINARGEVQIEIAGDVLFDSGKATLKATAKKTLDGVANTLKTRYSGNQIRIEGHTDPAPVRTSGWDDNWDLGGARANAVRAYFETKGVKNLYIASFGATQLKSTKNQALNRRVDIVVVRDGR